MELMSNSQFHVLSELEEATSIACMTGRMLNKFYSFSLREKVRMRGIFHNISILRYDLPHPIPLPEGEGTCMSVAHITGSCL